MQTSDRQKQYWRRNMRVTLILLAIWLLATFSACFFARELNGLSVLGFPLGFYMGAQGLLLIYLAIVGFYAFYMNRLDREYGVDEGGSR
ncbi:DUF4212 domain-containing protein [Rhodocyclus purpureus]|uniref:DUF4212 domain-containing protein n=1 Tax=Rhodocyclus purpureus TaxID=1067 RepID=UPI001914B284|nr:DUF4212 domain-containing protein [Rhodocyclus purpureus]MBK5915098.1 hypothetical protein [Rhodocyclus purpureus]